MFKKMTLNVKLDDISYLKGKGISRSKFLRQAVEALKQKKFDYDYHA